MIYGATNSPLRPVAEEMEILAALGFDYLELCLDPPQADPEKIRAQRAGIEAAREKTGLDLPVAHLPTFVWLADVYPGIRDASVAEVVRALDLCRELGIKKAVLHPGYATGLLRLNPREAKALALETIDRILEASLGRDITLCLENLFPRSGQMYRPEEFTEVLARFPDLMMTLDLGHAFIQASPDRIFRMIEAGGRRIGHVHVSDNTGRDDDHLPIGVGRVDVAGGLAALKKIGYDQTMTLEVFSPDRDYLGLSLSKVKAVWAGADGPTTT